MSYENCNNISAIVFLEHFNEFNYYVINQNLNNMRELSQVLVINRTKENLKNFFLEKKFSIFDYHDKYKCDCYNKILKLVKNDYLAILRDDISYPDGFFGKLLDLYYKYPKIGFIGSDYPYISTKETFLCNYYNENNISLKRIKEIDDNFKLFIFGKKIYFKEINIELKNYFFANFLFNSSTDNYQLVNSNIRCRCVRPLNKSNVEYGIYEEDRKLAKKFNIIKKRKWYKDIFRYKKEGFVSKFKVLGIKFSFGHKREFIRNDAINIEKCLNKGRYKKIHGLVVVMAVYRKDNCISENLTFYLRELKKFSDYIICVGDNPIIESEIDKISDYVDYVIFKKHGEYDFGSYKRGIQKLKELEILNNTRLLLCNDSVDLVDSRLKEVFLQSKNFDVFGITINNFCFNSFNSKTGNVFDYFPHIQSYFVILSPNVFLTEWFQSFISSIKAENDKLEIVKTYEVGLSKIIVKHGVKLHSFYFHDDELVPNQFLCYLRKRELNYPIFVKHKIENEVILD